MPFGRTLKRVAFLGAICMASNSFSQVAVVVNVKSPVVAMTAEQVAAIYLGKSQLLPSGQSALPVDLPESSPLREQFYAKSTSRSQAQVKATWARLTFSGKATPPREVATSAEVKKYIAATPDAIGYVEKASVDGTVKVVLILE
ncbi:hypothetical protein JY96_06475 [Aquabacterium sp. NJ1]|uniref:hypothetical protein n=1 Tax=Aquabacterium sp. NJ1 TaxID=1538295 RepID=UPI00052DA164|nr:hypothetical protein [Aquabacterium sp. NJ1]KGM39795.1 hypothetical protein JY96_06475 [Aquabacterium sp. NJ1]